MLKCVKTITYFRGILIIISFEYSDMRSYHEVKILHHQFCIFNILIINCFILFPYKIQIVQLLYDLKLLPFMYSVFNTKRIKLEIVI